MSDYWLTSLRVRFVPVHSQTNHIS
uniref:Uncharacterized protein n=1 Tax=Anguilla anguilla TaxID=7936 RepID=A0A0E9SYG9_ANGAN